MVRPGDSYVTQRRPRVWVVEFDAFGAAVGVGVVSGALSVVEPFLTALTGTLAALALAGWITLLRQRGAGLAELGRPGTAVALSVLVGGTTIFFLAPGPLTILRGLVLGLALAPLWLAERNRSVMPAGPAGAP